MAAEWISATRAVGLTAYLVACLACGLGWLRCRLRGRVRSWSGWLLWVGGAQLALALDIAFDGRWKLHDLLVRDAILHGVYGQRRGPQLVALVLLLAATAASAAWVLRQFRGRLGAGLAATGTFLSIGLWCSESLSYHYVDRILYRMVGAAMAVSLLWAAFAALTCLGVWMESWRAR